MRRFLREWRVDRMTDRIARKPHGDPAAGRIAIFTTAPEAKAQLLTGRV